jgi:hypothetical protein
MQASGETMRVRNHALVLAVAGFTAIVTTVGAHVVARGEAFTTTTADRAALATPELAAAKRFSTASLIIELNATDGDAGLQVTFDAKPWRVVTVYSPDGRAILEYQASSHIRDFGMTELFSESNEPPFNRFPLEEFKALFPEGKYRFVGHTIRGERLVSTVTFSHDLPAAPVFLRPEDGGTVSADGATIKWRTAPQPAGVKIVGYQVTLEREDPLRIYSVDLPADARRVRVPGVYLEPGVEYSTEVLAIEASGNKTLTAIDITAE